MSSQVNEAREQAIAWMVAMQSGRTDSNQSAQFEAWLQANVAHQKAWGELEGSLGRRLNALRVLERRKPSAVEGLKALLVEERVNRRDVLRTIAGLGIVGAGLVVFRESPQGQRWLADLSTGTGERRSFVLGDGSHLSLNACSAVDFDQDRSVRLLRLRQGELIVQVASDANRPFIVRSPHGEIRALGTRFLVRAEALGTAVTVLEHSVQLSTGTRKTLILQEGDSAFLQRDSIQPMGMEQRFRAEWLEGRLRVDDEALSNVVEALRPYSVGFIRLGVDASNLRVTGVFSLDDPDRTLTTLGETLPIRIRRFGPWLTLVDGKG